jgi:hypothetical protein
MDASKDKKEAPKGIMTSKNAMLIHYLVSFTDYFFVFLLYYFISVNNSFSPKRSRFIVALFIHFGNKTNTKLNQYIYSGDALSRETISAKWLRHFNNLAVGETAAPACFSRENAEGAGMPPILSY